MKKSKLLRSVTILTAFYFGLGMLFFIMAPSIQVYGMLARLPDAYQIRVPDLPPPEQISVLDQLPLQKALFTAWSVPVAMVWFISIAGGMVLVLFYSFARKRGLVSLGLPVGSFRGVKPSIGAIPTPEIPPMLDREVRFGDVKITAKQQALANEIFSMLAAHQDTYTGPGHAVGLYDHSLNVCKQMIADDDCDALMLIATAAHDLGKITKASRNPDGTAFLLPGHGEESARLMASLPSWQELPEDEREMLRLAVKFEHSPDQLPMVRRPPRDAVLALIARVKRSDRAATSVEKAEVMAKIPDLPEQAFAAFDTALPSLPLRGKGKIDGVKTVGFRQGNRLYLLEAPLRETVVHSYMPKDIAAAWELKFREGGQVHQFTEALLAAFHKRKWLVTAAELRENPGAAPSRKHTFDKPTEALWSVFSGNKVTAEGGDPYKGLTFNGVIIIDLPDVAAGRAPPTQTNFEVCILRPTKRAEVESSHAQDAELLKLQKERHDLAASGKSLPSANESVASAAVMAVVGLNAPAKKEKPQHRGVLAPQAHEAKPAATGSAAEAVKNQLVASVPTKKPGAKPPTALKPTSTGEG